MVSGMINHDKPGKKNKMVLLKIFILFMVVSLFSLDWGNAMASGLLKDTVSDYAYTKGDYEGIDQAAKSVFYVEIYNSDLQCIGSGSGFIMFEECLLVTNQHVIDGAYYLGILDDNGKQYAVDQVVISDKEHDIAILYFPEGKKYNPLKYDTTFDDLLRGQPVLAIGSPKGMPGTVSDGIISAFPLFQGEDTRYIQTTAPISHGSSGGCLLNEKLKVIGVTSSGIDEGQNIGFAIPVYIVEKLYQQWNKRNTYKLGSAGSWDTVGAGLHYRISGKKEKGQPDPGRAAAATLSPVSTPEIRFPANTPEPPSEKGLDVIWDTTKKIKPGYSLLIDGKKLDWNNTLNSAVQVFKENGFEVYPVSEGQANLEKTDIVLCNTIPVRFIRLLKNTKDDGLNSVDMIVDTATDFESAVAIAEDLNQKLQKHLGSVRKTIDAYIDDKSFDVDDSDIRSAMEKAFSSGSDNVIVSIEYNDSLNLYIQSRIWNNKLYYDFEISLASWN